MSKEDFDKAMCEISDYAKQVADEITSNSHLHQLAADIKALIDASPDSL